jgi:hypothetical protein
MEFRLDESQINTTRQFILRIEQFDESNVHFLLYDGRKLHRSLYDDFVYYLGKPAKIMKYDVLNNVIKRKFVFREEYYDNVVTQPCDVRMDDLFDFNNVHDVCIMHSSIRNMPGFNPLHIRVPNGVSTVVSAVSSPEPQLVKVELCK